MATSAWTRALTQAATQHGLISLSQLRALEITRSQVRTAVERGRLFEAAPRV
jgi:hypothetical protein